jgi:hypothetical protein
MPEQTQAVCFAYLDLPAGAPAMCSLPGPYRTCSGCMTEHLYLQGARSTTSFDNLPDYQSPLIVPKFGEIANDT